MEHPNNDLKQTLIKQYSILSYKNPFELTERIKQKEWWVKETYRLKVQSQFSIVGYVFILLCLGSYIVSTFKASGSFWNITIPFTTIFIFLIIIRSLCHIEEKVRLFTVLQLAFEEKKEVVDSIL